MKREFIDFFGGVSCRISLILRSSKSTRLKALVDTQETNQVPFFTKHLQKKTRKHQQNTQKTTPSPFFSPKKLCFLHQSQTALARFPHRVSSALAFSGGGGRAFAFSCLEICGSKRCQLGDHRWRSGRFFL